jgi:ketosteroid isomerase-like protein
MEGLLGLYEQDAVFADFDGRAQGTANILSVHQEFLDSRMTLTLKNSVVFEVDNIALVHWSWTVSRSDGSVMEGVSAEVLRRQADGSWKFLIDNSDGSALVGLL